MTLPDDLAEYGDEQPVRNRRTSRKDTRTYCKGKAVPGNEHVPGEPFIHSSLKSLPSARCRWVDEGAPEEEKRWSCLHVIPCARCGKHLHTFEAELCPDRPAVAHG